MVEAVSGLVIGGKYRLREKLGQGGMGSVWLADHLTLESSVAVKLIDPEIAQAEQIVARFLREAKAAAALQSPHVVQIFDYGVDAGVPYIVMEHLKGESLADRLTRQERLAPALAAEVVLQMARAMTRAHEAGIVHRDLKPDNVFLVQNEDQLLAKVLDFGIAKSSAPRLGDASTHTGALLGTPFYMSPEQAHGSKTVDWRSDLWAMAVIAYECIVGRRPFEGTGLGELLVAICTGPIPVPSAANGVPRGFDAWFARATQRDPGARFQSARELADALRTVCVDETEPLELVASTEPSPGTPFDAGASPPAAGPIVSAVSSDGLKSTTTSPVSGGRTLSVDTGAPRAARSQRRLVVAAAAAGALALALGVVATRGGSAPSDANPLAPRPTAPVAAAAVEGPAANPPAPSPAAAPSVVAPAVPAASTVVPAVEPAPLRSATGVPPAAEAAAAPAGTAAARPAKRPAATPPPATTGNSFLRKRF